LFSFFGDRVHVDMHVACVALSTSGMVCYVIQEAAKAHIEGSIIK